MALGEWAVGTEDTSIIGAAFYLMDFIDGWSPISEKGWPEPYHCPLWNRTAKGDVLTAVCAGIQRLFDGLSAHRHRWDRGGG
ncbi:MAG: hypothetical protein OXE93_06080 [bacterium]|nr:hypothetical protein [bacterium]